VAFGSVAYGAEAGDDRGRPPTRTGVRGADLGAWPRRTVPAPGRFTARSTARPSGSSPRGAAVVRGPRPSVAGGRTTIPTARAPPRPAPRAARERKGGAATATTQKRPSCSQAPLAIAAVFVFSKGAGLIVVACRSSSPSVMQMPRRRRYSPRLLFFKLMLARAGRHVSVQVSKCKK
jgi:hypothetical protein